MQKISIATYNITHMFMLTARRTLFWHTRRHFVRHLIKIVDADIICLQEDFPLQSKYLVKHTKYAQVSSKSQDFFNKERCAILYDPSKFQLLEHGRFFLSKTPEKRSRVREARTYQHCTWAKFKSEDKEFFVFNAHFPVPITDESRRSIARAASSQVHRISANSPFFFCGDLNTWPSKWFYDSLGEGFLDTFNIEKQDVFNTRHEWPGRNNRRRKEERLDYIFIPSRMKDKFISYRIFRNKAFYKGSYWPPSDHCPVKVEISF